MNSEMVGMKPDSPLSKVHPVMLLGIFVFVSPFITRAFKFSLPGWISGVGVALILFGVVLTVMGDVYG